MEGTSKVMGGWDEMGWKGRKERNLRLWASEVQTKCNLAFTQWQKLAIWKITTLNENGWRNLWNCTAPVPTRRPAYPTRGACHGYPSPEATAQGCSFLLPQQSSYALTRQRGSAFPSSGTGTRLGLFRDLERRQSVLAEGVKAAHKFTHGLLQKRTVFCFSRQHTVGDHSWWDMSLTFKRLREFLKVIVPLTQSVLNILVVKIKTLNKNHYKRQ